MGTYKGAVMSNRIVVSVLILAILACPLWCGTRSCHAGQCCPVTQSATQSADAGCPDQGTASCCCADESSDSDDDHGPRRCPNKSCQGVCGGAVTVKPFELDGVGRLLFRPLIEADASLAVQRADNRSLKVVPSGHGRSGIQGRGNQGRLLRTRHMSFLC